MGATVPFLRLLWLASLNRPSRSDRAESRRACKSHRRPRSRTSYTQPAHHSADLPCPRKKPFKNNHLRSQFDDRELGQIIGESANSQPRVDISHPFDWSAVRIDPSEGMLENVAIIAQAPKSVEHPELRLEVRDTNCRSFPPVHQPASGRARPRDQEALTHVCQSLGIDYAVTARRDRQEAPEVLRQVPDPGRQAEVGERVRYEGTSTGPAE